MVKVSYRGRGGSGVVIKTDAQRLLAFVVTNKHVAPASGTGLVYLGGVRPYGCTWLGADARCDLALLAVTLTPDFKPAALGVSSPVYGQVVLKAGYPGGGPLRATQTQSLGFRFATAEGAMVLTLAGESIPGDSGGGVFCGDKLVGVVWGTGTGVSLCVGLEDVVAFSEACLARYGYESRRAPPYSPPVEQKPPILSPPAEQKPPSTPPILVPPAEQKPPALTPPEEYSKKIEEIRGLLADMHKKTEKAAAAAGKVADVGKAAAVVGGVETAGALAHWLPLLLVGSSAGVAVPLFLVGVWAVRKAAGRRQARRSSAPAPAPVPSPAVEAASGIGSGQGVAKPPAPVYVSVQGPVRTEREYVPVQGPNAAAVAYEAALKKVAQDYPGMLGTVQMIESLAKQTLSGMTPEERAK